MVNCSFKVALNFRLILRGICLACSAAFDTFRNSSLARLAVFCISSLNALLDLLAALLDFLAALLVSLTLELNASLERRADRATSFAVESIPLLNLPKDRDVRSAETPTSVPPAPIPRPPTIAAPSRACSKRLRLRASFLLARRFFRLALRLAIDRWIVCFLWNHRLSLWQRHSEYTHKIVNGRVPVNNAGPHLLQQVK